MARGGPPCRCAPCRCGLAAKLDEDGIPYEAATSKGYGVPLIDIGLIGPLHVLLDGGPVENVVAYSRLHNWVVRYQTDGRGLIVFNGRGALEERLTGEVKVMRV